MKKYLITFYIVILELNNIYSQKTLDFEIYGAPVYPNRFYVSQNYIDADFNYPHKGKDYFLTEFKDYTNKIESPIISFSTGVKLTYHISNSISIQSGLEYSRIGEKTDFGNVPKTQLINQNGVQIPITYDTYNLIMIYKYDYLTLPICLNYCLLGFDKMNILPSLSLNLDYLINKSVKNSSDNELYKYDSKFESENFEFKTITSSISLGLELNYSISENLMIYIKPYYNQSFIPNYIVTDKYYKIDKFYIRDKIYRYNYSIGVYFGLRFIDI